MSVLLLKDMVTVCIVLVGKLVDWYGAMCFLGVVGPGVFEGITNL